MAATGVFGLASVVGGFWSHSQRFRSKSQSVSIRPSAGSSHFSLTRQREVTKRKATRLSRRHRCAMPVPCATRH